MIVFTTVHNCDHYLRRCLDSLVGQSYQNWRCHVFDDASDEPPKNVPIDERFAVIRNEKRLYQLGNYARLLASDEVGDDEICVCLDGDDYLPDDGVLSRVRLAYADDVWVTWGSCLKLTSSGSHVVHQGAVDDPYSLRRLLWVPCHLRTWKAFLWRKIKDEDLRDGENYWTCAGDLAFMYPMVEMAAGHSKFLPEINYCYNYDNPLANHKVNSELQTGNAQKIRKMRPYLPARIF